MNAGDEFKNLVEFEEFSQDLIAAICDELNWPCPCFKEPQGDYSYAQGREDWRKWHEQDEAAKQRVN